MTCLSVRSGSIRGVDFHFDTGSESGGRRGATHQYPYREEHYDQDLGAIAPTFRFSGYIDGDVRSRHADLRNALSAPGYGLLYDAYLNESHLVRCTNYTLDTSRFDLNRVSFTASFVERGAEPAPSALRTAIAAINGVLSDFNEALASGYSLVNGSIDDVTALSDGFSGAGSYFAFGRRRFFSASDDSLSSTTALLSGSFGDGAQALVETAIDGILDNQTEQQQIDFLDYLSNISGSGPAAGAQALLFGGVALSRYSEIIVSADYASRTRAVSLIRDFTETVGNFVKLSEGLGLLDVAHQARRLGVLAGGRVSTELGDTPVVSTISGSNLPALVLSHRVYGDIEGAQELMEMNGFASGSSMSGDISYVLGQNA